MILINGHSYAIIDVVWSMVIIWLYGLLFSVALVFIVLLVYHFGLLENHAADEARHPRP